MKKNSKLKVVVLVVIVAVAAFAVRPLVTVAYYSRVYEGYLGRATNDVGAALAGFGATYHYADATSCSKETIRTAPSSLDRTTENTNLWLALHFNCMTKSQDGTIVLNQEQRTKFASQTATMQDSLKASGWTGGGWLASYGYMLANFPMSILRGASMGIYSKQIPGGHCWFDFSSDYNAQNDTVMSTQVWCDKGYETYSY